MLCGAHVSAPFLEGSLRELSASGYVPDVVVGTGVGALYAARIAESGLTAASTAPGIAASGMLQALALLDRPARLAGGSPLISRLRSGLIGRLVASTLSSSTWQSRLAVSLVLGAREGASFVTHDNLGGFEQDPIRDTLLSALTADPTGREIRSGFEPVVERLVRATASQPHVVMIDGRVPPQGRLGASSLAAEREREDAAFRRYGYRLERITPGARLAGRRTGSMRTRSFIDPAAPIPPTRRREIARAVGRRVARSIG